MSRYVIASPVGVYVERAQTIILKAYGVSYTSDARRAMSFDDEESAKRFAEDWKIPKILKPTKRA